MSKFLVTGGAGFIGGHIVELLVSEAHAVTVFDNFSTGRMENLDAVADGVETIEGDVRDPEALAAAAKGVEFVIHQAAQVSTLASVEDPVLTNAVNVGGTLNMLVAAREAGVRRVVMASSCAVYGDTGDRPQREDFLPQPLSPYGASKLAGEHYMAVFHKVYGLETVRLRYFNVFGPRQSPDSDYAAVIPKFIDRILKGLELRIYGDGAQTRDFVHVEDVARANLMACIAPGAPGGVFNIASEKTVSVNELARQLSRLAGREVAIVYDPPAPGDIRHSSSDISLARGILGYEPLVGFEEGLERTFAYFAAESGTI